MRPIPQLEGPDTAHPIRVLLADDHEIFRQGLRLLLEQGGYSVVSEAANGPEAIRVTRSVHPDIAILDYGMPGMTGIDAAREIQKHSKQTQIILLVTHEDEVDAVEALRVGIRGYLYKSQNTDELVKTISEVANGDIHFSASIPPGAIDTDTNGKSHHVDMLSNREHQVLIMLASGHTNKAIGVALGVSRKTIESHRSSIMRKLNIHRTAGLILYAIRQHLITP
ncbi:MAG: response regulator [Gammaproteobacteria bacterium]